MPYSRTLLFLNILFETFLYKFINFCFGLILFLCFLYNGVRLIASRILHEICLLIGELAIRERKLTLNACLGT